MDLPLNERRFGDFLEQLSSKTPTPGGGAVASAVGALGAALANMVLAYSVGRKNLATHTPKLEDAAARLRRARTLLLELAAEDERVYGLVNELSRLEQDHPRRADLPEACGAAAQVPLTCVATCLNVLGILDELPPITNTNLRSDLAIAAVLAEAAARSAAWNVEVNLPLIADPAVREGLREQCASMLENTVATARRVERACRA
ncbi:MAG: cyclodeaminase/cyclohydrolase family protein [Phycisphaerales bacterium]|nr:cyclodeaminase/cyclohydrolase family protein [Phycisphaerales bacterium]